MLYRLTVVIIGVNLVFYNFIFAENSVNIMFEYVFLVLPIIILGLYSPNLLLLFLLISKNDTVTARHINPVIPIHTNYTQLYKLYQIYPFIHNYTSYTQLYIFIHNGEFRQTVPRVPVFGIK